jgi:hypothetical protein
MYELETPFMLFAAVSIRREEESFVTAFSRIENSTGTDLNMKMDEKSMDKDGARREKLDPGTRGQSFVTKLLGPK